MELDAAQEGKVSFLHKQSQQSWSPHDAVFLYITGPLCCSVTHTAHVAWLSVILLFKEQKVNVVERKQHMSRKSKSAQVKRSCCLF